MRLASFTIGSEKEGDKQRFKNLKNVTVDFDEAEWITVVIGWNGTGKSNVLEALATLFRDLIMGKDQWNNNDKPSFAYVLRYFCRNKEIEITADPDAKNATYSIRYRDLNNKVESCGQVSLFNNDQECHELQTITYGQFKKHKNEFLPKYVFAYYSGHSDRMQQVFLPYLQQYDKKLRNANSEDPGLRRLFYALPVHSQFILLSFVLQQDELIRDFLDNQLSLDTDERAEGIDSVLFVLNEPPWNRNKGKKPKGAYSACEDNPDIFWGAEGVARQFLDRVHHVATAPIKIGRKDDSTFWNKKDREYLYLFVKDLKKLNELAGKQNSREFFRDLESTYVSELIKEVRIRVKLKKNDGGVTFRELSEGEQQLLTVLGLLRFTAEEESLFLLDEPDTHLNPKWSVDYIEYLNKFVTSNNSKASSSHIVLTTHNPIAIAELTKEQLQILYRDPQEQTITSSPPEYDPRGMGYAGIVTSDMFGLASSLDKRTQRRLETYRALASVQKRTAIQELRFQIISKWLDSDRFTMNQRDDDYQRYLSIRHKILAERIESDDYKAVVKFAMSMSAEEREKIAQDAITKLLEDEN
ncbi:AAA family ATPase [Photorhabdus khanii]|uniref:Chromosome segregation protein SMC n=1 Tax=Photorhabdus khanii subsp. guanajuatensis TaxID=2100166 RepID=A0A4R4J4D0_9GAMM|nr:AAA family ATPase [Photorhabdus khanii]TDB48387.1 chromosome segregation protein SMC [Photorhabdus khanii subsp. guanajuatensis]